MAKAKPSKLVTFNIDPDTWSDFRKICREKDISASQALRKYISLIATGKLTMLY